MGVSGEAGIMIIAIMVMVMSLCGRLLLVGFVGKGRGDGTVSQQALGLWRGCFHGDTRAPTGAGWGDVRTPPAP